MSIRLLIADDEQLARAGVVSMLTGTEIEIVSQTTDCQQTINYALTNDPDVVLLDLRLGNENGFAALEHIKKERPEISVLVFSASDSLADIAQAHYLGADGYVCKTATREELLQAIRKAATGRDTWSRQQRRRVSSALLNRSGRGNGTPLTPREMQVLHKVAEGMANEEIAEELKVNIETVKHHVKRILAKLGVEHRTQAAIWAVRQGLV